LTKEREALYQSFPLQLYPLPIEHSIQLASGWQIHPIERLWQFLKSKLAWRLFDTLEQLREAVAQELEQLQPQTIASLTGWDFILDALSVAGIY
jgi:hypothetical protein